MPERRIVIGALATSGAIVLALTLIGLPVKNKLDTLPVIAYIAVVAAVILGIVLAFCFFYYGETPRQVFHRVRAEERHAAEQRRIAKEAAQKAARR